jgi:hypothetical protein
MRNFFVRILKGLDDRACRILAFEAVLFSGVYAAAHLSWVVFGVMLFVLWGLLALPGGKINATIALSALWGFIGAAIGYGLGREPWAIGLGLAVFVFGLLVHAADLLPASSRTDIEQEHDQVVNYRMNPRWGGQALN